MAAAAAENNGSQPLPRFKIGVTIAVVFLYWISLYLFVPTLPVYVKTKVNDLAVVGVILSMYGFWQMLARMPTGIIADWIGLRRPDILVGLVLVGLGAWIMSSAQGATGLLVGRAITGVAAGAWVPLVVLFTSLYPPKDVIRATALLTVINTLGRIIGSASTGFLNDLGGYPLAFYCSIGAAGLGIVILMFIKEKRTPSQPPSFRKLKRLFVRRDVFVPALLDTVLHYGDWTASFTFIPLLAAQFGAGNVALSALGTLNLGMVLLGNALSTALANRLGPKKLLVISFVIQASGMVGAALAPSLVVVFAAQVLVGMAFGIGYPILMGLSIKKVDHSEQNSAMGLHQSLYALGMFTGPWLSGLLAKALGIQPMFGIIAGAILVAGLLGERLLRE